MTKNAVATRERDSDQDLVRLYLDEVGSYRLLNKDDEVRLARQIEEGVAARAQLEGPERVSPAAGRRLRQRVRLGEEAKQAFILANLRLVVSIAKKYQHSGLPLLDLVQEGNLGLMHAVDKFDWRKGFKFSTYATWWIRQAIQRGVANSSRTIRLPLHAADLVARVQKARERLEAKLGRAPLMAELAEAAGMDEPELMRVLGFPSEARSLSEPLGEDSDTELGDVLADARAASPSEEAVSALMAEEVQKVLGHLRPDEMEVLVLRYGLDGAEPRSPAEVAEHLELGPGEVRRIEARALSKLRHPSAGSAAAELLEAA